MKKLFEIIWAVLLYLWQLPQNFIGLAYLAYCCDRVKIIKPGLCDPWPVYFYLPGEH